MPKTLLEELKNAEVKPDGEKFCFTIAGITIRSFTDEDELKESIQRMVKIEEENDGELVEFIMYESQVLRHDLEGDEKSVAYWIADRDGDIIIGPFAQKHHADGSHINLRQAVHRVVAAHRRPT